MSLLRVDVSEGTLPVRALGLLLVTGGGAPNSSKHWSYFMGKVGEPKILATWILRNTQIWTNINSKLCQTNENHWQHHFDKLSYSVLTFHIPSRVTRHRKGSFLWLLCPVGFWGNKALEAAAAAWHREWLFGAITQQLERSKCMPEEIRRAQRYLQIVVAYVCM